MLLPRAASNLADRITIDLQEDRMTRAKRTIGLMTAVLVLAVGALSAQAQTQFGGTWTLDPSQSQLPAHEGRHAQKAPDGAQATTFARESTWTVSPDGRTLTIDTVMHTPRGDRTMKTVYLKG